MTAQDALRWLETWGTKENVAELKRYGITAERPFGVTVGDTKKYSKEIGTDHELAQQLWESGRYEARLLAAFVDDPDRVTARQMNDWAKDFDSWAIVDAVCFHLFDRTPHAWKKVSQWAKSKHEFTKRAAFALIWSLSVHDKTAPDAAFQDGLSLIEWAAGDDRDYVKKAISMALRAVGKRNWTLNAAAIETARRLAQAEDKTRSWIGRGALRELEGEKVRARLGKADGS